MGSSIFAGVNYVFESYSIAASTNFIAGYEVKNAFRRNKTTQ